MTTYEIQLRGDAATGDRISASALRDVLGILVDGSRRALRYRLEGRSTAKGTPPQWIRSGARFEVLRDSAANNIKIEAHAIGELIPERLKQGELFRPLDPSRSALALFEESLEDALLGKEDSDLFDEGLVAVFADFRSVLDEGIDGIDLVNGRTLSIDIPRIDVVDRLRRQTPAQQAVRVVGVLDVIQHSTRNFTLLVGGGAAIRGIAPEGSEARLRELFGEPAVVTGTAVFRPSGTVLRIDADTIGAASAHDKAVFSALPPPLLAPLDSRVVRTARKGAFLEAIGQWPGDESDEEIEAGLRAIS